MWTRNILVGTDGSDGSRAAVRWAAREAERRDALLRVVHAFDWEWHAARYTVGSEYLDVARQHADAVIANATDEARGVAPAIHIKADAVIGNPVPQLLDSAADADLLVVGNRGRGGFASLLLGSVSQRLALHASCPVVVVRGDSDAGVVAVGVDDSPAAEQVLDAAFTAATERGCGVVVIHTYLPPTPLWLASDVSAVEVETPEQDAIERERLEKQLVPWREKFPDVPVETVISHDSAAGVLVGVSKTAQLVVVGSRGHGALAGALLGSTGMQLVHHAHCPVLIVRPRIREHAER
jgi:nucleotide-binding universal stress UspA family protein